MRPTVRNVSRHVFNFYTGREAKLSSTYRQISQCYASLLKILFGRGGRIRRTTTKGLTINIVTLIKQLRNINFEFNHDLRPPKWKYVDNHRETTIYVLYDIIRVPHLIRSRLPEWLYFVWNYCRRVTISANYYM